MQLWKKCPSNPNSVTLLTTLFVHVANDTVTVVNNMGNELNSSANNTVNPVNTMNTVGDQSLAMASVKTMNMPVPPAAGSSNVMPMASTSELSLQSNGGKTGRGTQQARRSSRGKKPYSPVSMNGGCSPSVSEILEGFGKI